MVRIEDCDRALDDDEAVGPEEGEPERHQAEEGGAVESFYTRLDEQIFRDNHDAKSESEHEKVIWIPLESERGDDDAGVDGSQEVVIRDERNQSDHDEHRQGIEEDAEGFFHRWIPRFSRSVVSCALFLKSIGV